MNKSVAFTGLALALALVATLRWLSAPDAAAIAGGSRPAIGTPAPAVGMAPAPVAPASPPAMPAPALAGGTAAPAAVVPAFTSDTQRLATQEQRREAMPAFLQAADATLARVRGELAELEARGAPATEIAAKAGQLRRLTEVRAQVLARNADITTAR